MPQPSLLVLAAGIGSRYGGLKQIDPIGPGGETIIDYSVFDALRAGFGKLIFVIRRDIERPFREFIGSRFENRIEVHYVFQELDKLPSGFAAPPIRQKPWGTGHALLMGAEVVREPFGVINADDFYGRHSFEMLGRHLSSGNPDYAMVGFVLRNTLSEFGSVARGVCRTSPDGFLEGVTETTRIERDGQAAKYTDAAGQAHPLTGDEVVSLNLWGFTPSIFDSLRREMLSFLQQHGRDDKAEFFIPTVVNTLVASGEARLRVLPTPDSWFGVTYREDRPRFIQSVRELIQRGDYPERLWG
ncbi:MAG TPA: sugar phosphate nucleotidyltransferase [Candidatus Acidoferrum sp.]|nr:sugar phosphate nucleotidyltransferase [Candidatus Acidoferrum sp.]